MKISILGWNGALNVGDDAMTFVIIKNIMKFSRVDKLYFTTYDRKSELKYLNYFPKSLKVKFNRLGHLLKPAPLIRSIYFVYLLPLYLIFTSDLIIIGGGSIFHTARSNQIYNNILSFRKLFFRKVKVISLGVSVGPFNTKSAEKEFLKILDRIDYISLRDARSFEYCKSKSNNTTIEYLKDLALFLPNYCKDLKSTNVKQQICIILRQGFITPSVTNLIVDVVNYIHTSYPEIKIIFASACELKDEKENDSLAIKDLIKNFNKDIVSGIEIFKYNEDPIMFYKLLGESIFSISMRLHGCIISYAMERPFISISYHQKCLDFIRDRKIPENFNYNLNSNQNNIKGEIDYLLSGNSFNFENTETDVNFLDRINELTTK